MRGGWQILVYLTLVTLPAASRAQAASQPASSSSKRTKPSVAFAEPIEADAVTNGAYHNRSLGLSCKIPEGWVLRTDEMNARDEERKEEKEDKPDPAKPQAPPASSAGAKVLLAAFSRPPEAKGEDVNSSILIAAESASSYPGLKEAGQYFAPLIEVAKGQGFAMDEDPYDIAIGSKTLVRADFHKDVGSRVMRQSTLVFLSHGYAVSITVIAGTDDDVEDLVDGISFSATAK